MQAARRKQIAASIEALIYGDTVSLNLPETTTPRLPQARHIAPQKRQSITNRTTSPTTPPIPHPTTPPKRPNNPSDIDHCSSTSPHCPTARTPHGFNIEPIGDGQLHENEPAADGSGAWRNHLLFTDPQIELYEGHTYPTSFKPTTVLPLGGQHHGTGAINSVSPNTHNGPTNTVPMDECFANHDLSRLLAITPQAPASLNSGPSPREPNLASCPTPRFVYFDFEPWEDARFFEPTVQAHRPLSPPLSLDMTTGSPTAVPVPMQRDSTARSRAVHPPQSTPRTAAARHTRSSQRPHAVVEKRYRASINDKLDALRRYLEARKRDRRVDLDEALIASCGLDAVTTSQTLDHATGLDHASGQGGGNTLMPPAPDPAPSARMNKAEVLVEAVEYIQQLEEENEIMMKQLGELVTRLRATRQALLPPTQSTSTLSSSSSP